MAKNLIIQPGCIKPVQIGTPEGLAVLTLCTDGVTPAWVKRGTNRPKAPKGWRWVFGRPARENGAMCQPATLHSPSGETALELRWGVRLPKVDGVTKAEWRRYLSETPRPRWERKGKTITGKELRAAWLRDPKLRMVGMAHLSGDRHYCLGTHAQMVAVVNRAYRAFRGTPYVRERRDCDNFACKLAADVAFAWGYPGVVVLDPVLVHAYVIFPYLVGRHKKIHWQGHDPTNPGRTNGWIIGEGTGLDRFADEDYRLTRQAVVILVG